MTQSDDPRKALALGWEIAAEETRRVLDDLAREKGIDPEELHRKTRREIELWEVAGRRHAYAVEGRRRVLARRFAALGSAHA